MITEAMAHPRFVGGLGLNFCRKDIFVEDILLARLQSCKKAKRPRRVPSRFGAQHLLLSCAVNYLYLLPLDACRLHLAP